MYSGGMAIRDIGIALEIPYSTVGGWVKGTSLSKEGAVRARKRLEDKLAKARSAAQIVHHRAKATRMRRDEQILADARLEVLNSPSESEIRALFIGIYLGEGNKTTLPYKIAVTNSDPAIIRLCLKVFRSLGVSDDDFHVYLQIHSAERREEAVRYWAEACHLPAEKFRVYILCSRTSKQVSPKRIPNGVLQLALYDVRLAARISGWLGAAHDLASEE